MRKPRRIIRPRSFFFRHLIRRGDSGFRRPLNLMGENNETHDPHSRDRRRYVMRRGFHDEKHIWGGHCCRRQHWAGFGTADRAARGRSAHLLNGSGLNIRACSCGYLQAHDERASALYGAFLGDGPWNDHNRHMLATGNIFFLPARFFLQWAFSPPRPVPTTSS